MMHVPVLIAGGGPVGLTASFLLSRLGIRSLLVERHPGTAIHPKARGINARTMEIFHQQGIEAYVREAGLPPESVGLIVWTRTLSGEEIERRVPFGQSARRAEITPVRACLCAQDYLEPVLGAAPSGRPWATCASTPSSRRSSRTGRRRRHAHEHGDGRHRKGAGAIHDRRRRHPKPRAQHARHRHARREGRL